MRAFALLLIATCAWAAEAPLLDRVFNRIYNCDFGGAYKLLDAPMRAEPDNAMLHAVLGAAILFDEFQRLRILETEYFADDEQVTDKKRLKPDPAVKARLMAATAAARNKARARLAVAPNDRDAMFALSMAAGLETEYTSLVEKRYFRSYSLSKESQLYARRLLSFDPPVYDAYLTIGSVEYVVGSLNPFFRFFIRFDKIEGNKQKGIELVRLVAERGHYYKPFAKILLSVAYLREKQPAKALVLLRELEHEFPENPLIRNEVVRVARKVH